MNMNETHREGKVEKAERKNVEVENVAVRRKVFKKEKGASNGAA